MKEDYQIALKKFIFLNPVSFKGKDYEKKRGLELVTSRSSGYKASPEISLLVMYYLTSLMMQYKVVFELFQNLNLLIHASQFMT